MLKPEQVPDEVVEAAIDAMSDCGSEVIGSRMARAAIAAALNAWPGMHTHEWQRPWLGGMSGTDLILPLAQKQEDGDA